MYKLAQLGRTELQFFQPGKTEIIDFTDSKTLVTVVFGKLKIRRVGGNRERVDAYSFSPVLLKPGQYIFESPKYSGAVMRRA